MDAGILLSKFINKYILGISPKRYRNLRNGQYVCSTGFVRAIPRHTNIIYYTDFHKEDK